MNEKTKRDVLVRQVLGWFCVALGVVLVVTQPGDRLLTFFGFPAFFFSVGVLQIELTRLYARIAKVEEELEALRNR